MTTVVTDRPVFARADLERAFRRDGYVLVDLADDGETQALLSVYRTYASRHGDGFSASILSPDLAYRRNVDAAVGSVLRARLAALLSDYRVIHAGFAVKSANSPDSEMVMHQDMTFVDETGRPSLSVWCPLIDVDPSNGCLQVVPGSYRCNPNPRPPLPLPYGDLVPVIRAKHLRDMPMRAGQAIVMHPRTFHCSAGNAGADPRVVAVAVAAPRESRLLYCHGPGGTDGASLDLFAVDDAFFRTHAIGSVPQSHAQHLGRVPYVVEPLTEELLAARVDPRAGPP